jgi:hypothetical protein
LSAIVVAGDTSGSITIAAPAVAGSGTLTLPVATDTLIGKATTDTLTNKSIAATQLTGTIAAAALPAGSVLQVVQASTTTLVSNSTLTYADTTLTATITPKFATSKILVFVSQATQKTAANLSNGISIKLFRASTDLGLVIYAQGYTGTTIVTYTQAAFQYLDSPATTSATIYKTQFANIAAAAAVVVQPDNIGVSYITLMEIAG